MKLNNTSKVGVVIVVAWIEAISMLSIYEATSSRSSSLLSQPGKDLWNVAMGHQSVLSVRSWSIYLNGGGDGGR